MTDVPTIMFRDGYERGVAAERARIVAWLRSNPSNAGLGAQLVALALRVERGEHLRVEPAR